MSELVRETLERSLDALHHFACPSHHRQLYERTELTLRFLHQPGTCERVAFVESPAFAPLCADIVPDSGVCFLRCATRGPKDLASDIEHGVLSGGGLFLQLWDDALGIAYPPWREMADRAPAIFVRLGESVCTEAGRWQWAPLSGPHRTVSYPNVSTAFAALVRQSQEAGDAEHTVRLKHWQHGIFD